MTKTADELFWDFEFFLHVDFFRSSDVDRELVVNVRDLLFKAATAAGSTPQDVMGRALGLDARAAVLAEDIDGMRSELHAARCRESDLMVRVAFLEGEVRRLSSADGEAPE